MKKYYYQVAYLRKNKKGDRVGDCSYSTTLPIQDARDINLLRQTIKEHCGTPGDTVIILNFILLRVEDIDPEEPCDPDTNDPSQFPACGDDILDYR